MDMTEEEKTLLLKDLTGRLPYGVICHSGESNCDGKLHFINTLYNTVSLITDKNTDKREVCSITDCKPYLRKMSSMTEEERKECNKLRLAGGMAINVADYCDWLNAHHFDYRGLIEMGLALEAPNGMYNI